MSIYIQGMEMPHSCSDCIMSNFECDWCILSKSKIPQECHFEKRMKRCPLTHVPEHGDLIDRNALKDKWTHKDLDLFSQGWGWLRDLNQAPTVIPAEPPKEE